MKRKAGKTRKVVKTGEAAAILGVTTSTIRAAVRRGDLAGYRLGTQFLVSRSEVERLAELVTPDPQEAA